MLAEIVSACAGGALITAWAVQLQCSSFLVALFSALPFLSQAVHLPTAWFSKRCDRRRLALLTLTLSRQLLLGLALLPLLRIPDGTQRALFGALVLSSSILGVVGNNAWVSWMGDLVPTHLRARYFARRATWSTWAGALGALASGLVVDAARRRGDGAAALGALSAVAWLAGMVCTWLISRQHNPGPRGSQPTRSGEDMRQPWRCRRARPVLAYQLVWNAAIGLAGGLFGLFLLRYLRTSFTFLAFHGALLGGVRALATPIWGRTLDRVGTRPVLVTTSFGIALIPLLWLLPARYHFAGPLALDAAVSGLLWAGHGLASFQLPLVVSPEVESRPFYVAAFSSVGGVAFAVAALGGGLLLPSLPAHFVVLGVKLTPLHGIFVLSTLLRLAAWTVSLFVREPGAAPVAELWRGLTWWPGWLRLERVWRLAWVPVGVLRFARLSFLRLRRWVEA
jgi:hypothetical protein